MKERDAESVPWRQLRHQSRKISQIVFSVSQILNRLK